MLKRWLESSAEGINLNKLNIGEVLNMENFFADKTYDKIDYTNQYLSKGVYENCIFNNCNFSNTDLSEIKFIECKINACNLSLAKLVKTTFRDVTFIDCKMLGLHFNACDEFGVVFTFDNCNLSNSIFYRLKLKKTSFKNSVLMEVDFTECDLTNSVFDNCDFSGATFENTILEKADLRTSYNFSIDPEINRIKQAAFSMTQLAGLLKKYDILVE